MLKRCVCHATVALIAHLLEHDQQKGAELMVFYRSDRRNVVFLEIIENIDESLIENFAHSNVNYCAPISIESAIAAVAHIHFDKPEQNTPKKTEFPNERTRNRCNKTFHLNDVMSCKIIKTFWKWWEIHFIIMHSEKNRK